MSFSERRRHRCKQMIAERVAKSKVRSLRELTDMMAAQGFPASQTTCANYMREMGIRKTPLGSYAFRPVGKLVHSASKPNAGQIPEATIIINAPADKVDMIVSAIADVGIAARVDAQIASR